MAMGAVKGQAATLQVEMVCLDELVPAGDRYRKLDRLVDWSFVRELAAPYYAEDVGRPSIDPIVLVKLMVAGALEGIGSTRELLHQAGMRLDLRRFLGFAGRARSCAAPHGRTGARPSRHPRLPSRIGGTGRRMEAAQTRVS